MNQRLKISLNSALTKNVIPITEIIKVVGRLAYIYYPGVKKFNRESYDWQTVLRDESHSYFRTMSSPYESFPDFPQSRKFSKKYFKCL